MKRIPIVAAGVALLWLAYSLVPAKPRSVFDLAGFGALPVLSGGRVKPIDSVARVSLLMLSGKQTLSDKGRHFSAIEWLSDVLFKAPVADDYKVFSIDDPDVLGMIGTPQTDRRRYAFSELRPHLSEIEAQAARAEQVKSGARTRYQAAVVNLQGRLTLYQKLQNTLQVAEASNVSEGLRYLEIQLARGRAGQAEVTRFSEQFKFLAQAAEFRPMPYEGGFEWFSVGDAGLERMHAKAPHPGLAAYAALADSYREGDVAAFGEALSGFKGWLAEHARADMQTAGREVAFNAFDPFYKALLLYGTAFLLVFVSWLRWPEMLSRTAYGLALIAFIVHTGGLIARIVLQGRPPVTNLYSSALFVGWTAALLGLLLERWSRKGLGTLVSSAVAAMTLIIALHLDAQGDTMEMMRAVLDSNFWLATHVTCITIGYGSTFLSGFLAAFHVLQRKVDPRRAQESAAAVEGMVFGIVCFSTFFSFLGTILGGIWADQSWGRFWGWDPKENGALIIVLWNAAILHARWGKTVRGRGLMAAAILGNVVTAFSWFGVNMLGVGLHSYGFMDKAFPWLLAFSLLQIALAALAFV